MKKIYIFIFLSMMAVNAFANEFSLTEKEQKQIFLEAEEWIDNMPEGLQDHLSDAVNHSLRGFFSELQTFRNIADTSGSYKFKVTVKDIRGGNNSNIQMRIYKGKTGNKVLPLLIYFHGGGWSLGNLDTSDKFCRALASKGDLMVVSIDYPLAPEYPYPTAIDVCIPAVDYIIGKAKEWGSNESLISLGGDGAGGNLAVAIYEKLPSSVKIRSLVLYYPLLRTDGQLNNDNKRQYGRGFGFDSRLWESFLEAYKGKEIQFTKKLPPTLIISAGRDIIVDEARQLASKGIDYIEFEGALHGFITDGHQPAAFNKAVVLTDQFLQTK